MDHRSMRLEPTHLLDVLQRSVAIATKCNCTRPTGYLVAPAAPTKGRPSDFFYVPWHMPWCCSVWACHEVATAAMLCSGSMLTSPNVPGFTTQFAYGPACVCWVSFMCGLCLTKVSHISVALRFVTACKQRCNRSLQRLPDQAATNLAAKVVANIRQESSSLGRPHWRPLGQLGTSS